jgi:Flp pilus assembly protein TadD
MARFADYAPGYFECSQAYTSCNDLAKAVTAIEQAIRVASAPRAEYHSLAGAIYEKLHRHLDAQSAYDRARQLED